jgi:hypothetical protein
LNHDNPQQNKAETNLKTMESQSEILFYTADDGKTKIQVKLENETVWLSQKQIAELLKVG